MKIHLKHYGFTLIELAFILLVISLLSVSILRPLATVIKTRMHTETQENIKEAFDAALGFAVLNRRLPCPDTDNDGVGNCGGTGTLTGTCPYADIGVLCRDGWKKILTWEVDASFTVVGTFNLGSVGSIEVIPETASGAGNQVYAPLRLTGQGHDMTLTHWLPHTILMRRMVLANVFTP